MAKNKQRYKPLVFGGGIAGMAAANQLRKSGQDPLLIERNATLGGLTRSIYVDDFIFDYTGHFLHLASLSHPDDLGLGRKLDWKRIERKAYCYESGCFIEAPFQYNLGKLPLDIRKRCLDGYLAVADNASYSEAPLSGESLLSYFYRTFGEGITDLFLKPYNEKILAISLKELSASAINRFFPAPKRSLIEHGAAIKGSPSAVGYNSSFWYPSRDGIQQLVNAMTSEHGRLHAEVNKIDFERKLALIGDQELAFDVAFSSVPLDSLMRLGGETLPGSAKVVSQLSHASVVAFQIGVADVLPRELVDKHWIYIADPRVPFHRVGIYSNFNESMAPKGAYSLYVEVGASSANGIDVLKLQGEVIRVLEQLGWVRAHRISVLLNHTINHGYVHFNHHWQETVPDLLADLESRKVYPIGRYGTWNYISMEDGVVGAWAAVNKAYGV